MRVCEQQIKPKIDDKDWFLYMVQCQGGQLYTGITTDVERRFAEHCANSKKTARYLRGKGPLTLVYHERVGDKRAALRREIAIKKLSRQQKLALINAD